MWYNVCLSLSNKLRGCQSSSLTVSDSVFSFRYFFLSVAPKNTIQDFLCRLHSNIKDHLMLLESRWVERTAFSSSHSLRSAAILSWSQGLWIYIYFFFASLGLFYVCAFAFLFTQLLFCLSPLLPVSVFPLVNCSHVLLFLSLHWYLSCSLISALCKHSNCPLCLLHLGSTNFDLFLLS